MLVLDDDDVREVAEDASAVDGPLHGARGVVGADDDLVHDAVRPSHEHSAASRRAGGQDWAR